MLAHICLALAVSLLMATPSLPGLIAWILEDAATQPTTVATTTDPHTLEDAA